MPSTMENVRVWRMAALEVAIGKQVARILSVQVSFNFVQVWAEEFNAKAPRTREAQGNKGKRVFRRIACGPT